MKTTVMTAALGLLMIGGQAMAQTSGDSPWLVRFRATHLDMANKDGTGLGLSVNNKTIPELDISYFFSPNVAAELVLTVPQKQKVSSTGVGGEIGTFKHLPPALLLQYHFTHFQGFKPYVGAGVNYTKISSVKLLDGAAGLDKDSWGAALQVGVDVPLTKNWSVNVDLKKVQIRSDVFLNGVNQGELKLDPTLLSVGVGYRF